MKKSVLFAVILIFTARAIYSQSADTVLIRADELYEAQMEELTKIDKEHAFMESESYVNWTKSTFKSFINLDINKAGIPMPSGKSSAVNKIQMELPPLIKDPLLSLYVDDFQTIGDLVLQGTFTLEQLSQIIAEGNQTPAYFEADTSNLRTSHSIDLKTLGSLLVKHHSPYTLRSPIEQISSRPYTGIIIDARGSLPVHGEFTEEKVEPCLFPKIYSEDMDLLFERNMVEPELAKETGIVYYGSEEKLDSYIQRAGRDPMWITAKKVYGVNRCDPVISREDYLKITTVPENLDLLRQGKVVLLLEKEQLEHAVRAPEIDRKYYLAYQNIKKYFIDAKVPDVVVLAGPTVFQVSIRDLKFLPDSPELLSSEKDRIQLIAKSLKLITAENDYSILVEGHTADVNKPEGQLTLSLQRALAVIDALAKEGVPRSLFTYKGYGGTLPVADNSTEQGRAQNRRVELKIMPKAATVQRR